MLVDKAKAAIQKAAEEVTVGKVFFAWLQGESDALESNTKAYYKGRLEEMVQALFESVGDNVDIQAPFYCDYGYTFRGAAVPVASADERRIEMRCLHIGKKTSP